MEVEALGKLAGYMIDGVGNRAMYQANFPASAEAGTSFYSPKGAK